MQSLRSKTATTKAETAKMTNAQIMEQLNKMNEKMDDLKASFDKKLNSKVDGLEKSLDKTIRENQKLLLNEMERCRKEMKEGLDMEVSRLQARLESLEMKLTGATPAPTTRFDPEVSLIIYGLQQEDDEDILVKTNKMFTEGMSSDIVAKDAERMKSRGGAPGVVKVECTSRQEKISILRMKQKLRDHPVYEKVYVKSAKSHAERLIEINFKTILKEMPHGKNYFITGNGRLVKREDTSPTARRSRRREEEGRRRWEESRPPNEEEERRPPSEEEEQDQ